MTKKYYIPYFTHQELACKQTSKIVLAEGFAEKLVQLREACGKPMQVTSCCRSREYNCKIGGSKNSFHIYDFPTYPTGGTCAIDIAITDSTTPVPISSQPLYRSAGPSVSIKPSSISINALITQT